MAIVNAARPTSGAPIESTWGGQVHDAVTRAGGTEVSATVTTTVSINNATEAGAVVLATLPPITTLDGDVVEVMVTIPYVSCPTGAQVNTYLFENGVSLGRLGTMIGPGSANYVPVCHRQRVARNAGTWTYSIRASASSTATMTAGPGGPTFVMPLLATARRV